MTVDNYRQPALFISHGTIYEALKNEGLKLAFGQIQKAFISQKPGAIVLFSGHWQTETVSVTTGDVMHHINEGFPPEFQSGYTTPGDPALAMHMIQMLQNSGIEAKPEAARGLDHGALIPLLMLFPNNPIPVVQVSQQRLLDTVFHKQVAAALAPLRNHNVLFIGSGGLVHNRDEIVKFSGHAIPPDAWAKEFDDYITQQFENRSDLSYADRAIAAYGHPLFSLAHPTSEHYLPLVFIAALGGKPTKIHEGFQWKNLSMGAFKFD